MAIFNALFSLVVAIIPVQILLFAWQLEKRDATKMSRGQAYVNTWKMIGSAFTRMLTFGSKK